MIKLGEARFDGEHNEICHLVRDGKKYEAVSPEKCDAAILGGGISGLIAAYNLRDKKIVVIEKESKIGGASRRESWEGIYYSLGTADTSTGYEITLSGKRFDFLTPLFEELKVPWIKVPEPSDALMFPGKLVLDIFGEGVDDLPFDKHIRDEFKSAIKMVEGIKNKPGAPIIPPEASSKEYLRLDRISIKDFFNKFCGEFLEFLDVYCLSTFGASSNEISAFAGLHYLSRELGERYACPGGNACVSELLAKNIDDIRTGCFVVGIEQKNNSCLVTYVDAGGKIHTLESRSVIVAFPKHYAKRIIKGLPPKKIQAFENIRYDSYIVANILANSSFYDSSFATYFHKAFFADMIVADWMAKDKKAKKVYTIYAPVGEINRFRLLEQSPEHWKGLILDDLKRFLPGCEDKIFDLRLWRHGHHYVIPYPGYITGARKIAKLPFGRIFFAKDDMQGVPALESAVWSGIEAAKDARRKIEKSSSL